jgi:2-polyprenyl-3-methyl-5-hydroxy-6-metoxy-1,4-benzoquinol methylase
MAYLEKIYAEMGVKNDPPSEYFETDSRYMLLETILRGLSPGKLCDLGCGRGLLLRRLQDHHICYGTDFDPGAVQFCQSQGLKVQVIDLNAASELPFPDVVFDAIVISEVMEHLLEPKNALQVLKRHLRPGGTLVVTVPNAVPLFSRLNLLLGRTVAWLHYPSQETDGSGHIRFYTIESMARLLETNGFSVKKVSGVSFRFNGHFWARLCYWVPSLLGNRSKSIHAKMDLWLGKTLPGLSPGILFVCKNC